MDAHYDDPSFSYLKYWGNRTYEMRSEEIALKKLLGKRKFKSSADIGGGYGRLSTLLGRYSQKVHLIEPSEKQRSIALKYLSSYPKIIIQNATAQNTKLDSSSQDLAILIRVLHHLPQPQEAIAELARILAPKGLAVIEFANSTNIKSKLKSLLLREPITTTPIEKRSPSNIRKNTIPFVNHHPQFIFKLLQKSNLSLLQVLSVSNFRIPLLKKIIPLKFLLVLESLLQKPLAKLFFGPSIFILVQKKD